MLLYNGKYEVICVDSKELMTYFGSKLKELRKERNLTQQQLGDRLGITKMAVSNYEKGLRMPKDKFLWAVVDYFKVSIDDFFPPRNLGKETEVVKMIAEKASQLNPENQIEVLNFTERKIVEEKTSRNKIVNLFDATDNLILEKSQGAWIHPNTIGAAAGVGTSHYADFDCDEIMIPEYEVYDDPHIVSMYVRGDSMEPKYFDGDIIWVDTNIKSIDRHQIGVFDTEDGRIVKQMGVNELISLNRKFDDIPLNEYMDFSVYGKVIDVIRAEDLEKFKKIKWV